MDDNPVLIRCLNLMGVTTPAILKARVEYLTKQNRLSFLQTSLLPALSVPRTSVRLHFVNSVHADRISDVLGFEFSQEVYPDGTKVGL